MILFPVKYTGPRMHSIRGPVYFESPFFSCRCFRMRPENSRGRQPAWNGITSPSPCRARAAASKLRTFPAVRVVHPRTALFIHTGSIESSPASAGSPPWSPPGAETWSGSVSAHHPIPVRHNIAHGIVNCLHFRPSSPSSSDPASAVSFSVPVSQGAVNHPPVPFPPAFDTTADSPGSQSPSSAPQTPPCPLPPWRPPSRSPQAGSGRSTAPPPDGRSR